jgi:lysophospholipase L1-like esterase
MSRENKSSGGLVSFESFFGNLGYSIFCVVVIVALLEFIAFSFWSVRQFLLRYNPHENGSAWSTSYDGQPWAQEFLQEQTEGGKRPHEYVPFRIWGTMYQEGHYINVDKTDLGLLRRTINVVRKECAGKPLTKIWVFGGSTVYGIGAPDWGTLPSYISASLTGVSEDCVEIRNLGVAGYVTNQEVILLIEELKRGVHPNVAVFYDGFNDSYAGAYSPGDPTAHQDLERVKLRVENNWRNKLMFLQDLYSVRLTRSILNRFQDKRSLRLSDEEIRKRASATLGNYQGNLKIIEALGNAYGFKTYFFWQPCLFYGSKTNGPFERELIKMKSPELVRAILAVYAEAERRSATPGSFVFLGRVFDQISEPLFIADGVHLGPRGNEILARAIAEKMHDGGVVGTRLHTQRDGRRENK